MANQRNTTLYTGVTGALLGRIWQHKSKIFPNSFTKKYNIDKLVYVEAFDNPNDAIRREKQIKAGSRRKKIELIEKDNPNWDDLSGKYFK